MKILKSMLLQEKEKLAVLSREISFIYEICDFYSKSTDHNKLEGMNIDLEQNFGNLKDNIIHLYEEISALDKNIESTFELNTGKNCIEILFYIDYFRKDINKIVKELKPINSKVFQMFRDGYNQYIPKPTPGRMFSNINMTSQIEYNLERKLTKFLESGSNISLSVDIIWDFSNSYKIKNVKTKDNKTTLFFQMSYWYFDLPFLIPALTHEIGHIVIEEDDDIKKEFQKKLYGYLVDKINLDKKIQFIFSKYIIDNDSIQNYFLIDHWTQEIISDIISLLYHGDAYLLTFAHSFLGYYFSDTFGRAEKYKNKIEIAPWIFNANRDSTFIRLAVLIETRKIIKSSNNYELYGKNIFDFKSEIIDEIEEIINSIYLINGKYSNHQTIKNYYNNWHNYLDGFKIVEDFILFIFSNIKTFLEDNQNLLHKLIDRFTNKTNDEESINTKKLPKYFKDLWVKRFDGNYLYENKVPHKYELRKKIHRETIIKIYNEIYKQKEDYLDIIKPYVLTFYKYKIDHLSDEELKKFKDLKIPESTLGIYDEVKLSQELQNSEDYIKPEIKELPKNEIKKYALKFNIMKILKDINGKGEGNLNVFIQIKIKKNLDKNDIYDNLFESIKVLYEYFSKDEHNESFNLVKTFKSLGPKDIIINIEKTNIEFIYEVKKFLTGNNSFSRTFTTISYSSNQKEVFRSNNKYVLVTNLRLSDNENTDITKLLSTTYLSKIKDYNTTTGVMDYRIEWNTETSLNDIDSFFEEMIGKKCVYDIQTYIEQKNIC